jgi:hypothetical protein
MLTVHFPTKIQNYSSTASIIPGDFFKRGFQNLPERWEAVVNNGGEYIIDFLYYLCEK